MGLDKEMWSQNSPKTGGYVLEYCKLRKNHVWWNHRWLSIESWHIMATQFVDVCRCIGSFFCSLNSWCFSQSPPLRSPASRISSRLHAYPTASCTGLLRNKTKWNMMGYLYHGIRHTIQLCNVMCKYMYCNRISEYRLTWGKILRYSKVVFPWCWRSMEVLPAPDMCWTVVYMSLQEQEIGENYDGPKYAKYRHVSGSPSCGAMNRRETGCKDWL